MSPTASEWNHLYRVEKIGADPVFKVLKSSLQKTNPCDPTVVEAFANVLNPTLP